MPTNRDRAIVLSDAVGLPRLFGAGPGSGHTTILYHRFRFGDETWQTARERLRRQLGRLCEAFEPIAVDALPDLLAPDAPQARRTLLVTIDDANRQNLEVADLFADAGIPVAHFVCAGWCDRSDPGEIPEGLKIRFVARLHFYDGPDRTFEIGGQSFALDRSGNAALIDAVIATEDAGDLERLAEADRSWFAEARSRPDAICNWAEIRDLAAAGATIGCHSVSHPMIARQSPLRQRFEIAAAQGYIADRIGACRHFAYPFGTWESRSQATHDLIVAQGFDTGFTTRPATSRNGADLCDLPRLVLPDHSMPDSVFAARMRGGGVPLSRLKDLRRFL